MVGMQHRISGELQTTAHTDRNIPGSLYQHVPLSVHVSTFQKFDRAFLSMQLVRLYCQNRIEEVARVSFSEAGIFCVVSLVYALLEQLLAHDLELAECCKSQLAHMRPPESKVLRLSSPPGHGSISGSVLVQRPDHGEGHYSKHRL